MTLVLADDADVLKRAVKKLGDFTFDVETVGEDPETGADLRLDPRRNTVFWITLAGAGGQSYTIPMGHPKGKQIGETKEPRVGKDGKTRNYKVPVWSRPPAQLTQEQVFEIIAELFFSDREKNGHNIKFDLESIEKYLDGRIIPGPYFDTQVASFILNENHHVYRLGDVVKREFGYAYDKSVGAMLDRYAFAVAARYVHLDGRWTELLKQKYKPLIPADELEGVWDLEMDILGVLLRMEKTGACLDVKAAALLKDKLERRQNELRGDLYRLAGGKEINFNSNPQMAELLFGAKADGGFGLKAKVMTTGGKKGIPQPSVSDAALEYFVNHPFVATFNDFKDVGKVLSTYLIAYLGGEVSKTDAKGNTTIEVKHSILVEGEDRIPRIHANFKQHGAVTGRFSCSEPNLQNIPRPDEEKEIADQIRAMFIAPPRHQLVVADYKQIEYMVLAHFSQDPMLIKAFEDGLDFHLFVASLLLRKPMEEVTKPERTVSKNTNFATVYGAGDDKVAAMSNVPLKQAVEFRALHQKMLPSVYRWTARTVIECKRARPPHVTTLLGRKRRLPTILSSDWKLRGYAERQAVNTKIQGSAADIIKLAMVRVDALCDDEIKMSLSVHDELVLVAPDDRVDDAQEILRKGMLGEGISKLLSVPLAFDMHVVDRWSQAK